MKVLIAFLATAIMLSAVVHGALQPEQEMQSFVDQTLAMTGLHNKVTVVVDPSAKGCAYAATAEGRQIIGIDPKCVAPLHDKKKAYNLRTVGILTHEIGHLLSGHTTNRQGSNPAEEAAADEWSGWAMYRIGLTLAQAQTCAASMREEGSATHPGRAVRMEAVARGWKNARDGRMPVPTKTFPERWAEFMKEPLPWVRQ